MNKRKQAVNSLPPEPVIECRSLWKIFSARADGAMKAIKNEGLDNLKVRDCFGRIVGGDRSRVF
jgi:hypothetical protein